MKIRLSSLATASAVALIGLAVPAAHAAAAAPGTQAPAASSAHELPVATGDPRHLGQPKVPATCETLGAALATSTGEFSGADETNPPDSARIQRALDDCAGSGEAVELAANGAADSFLSGPLTIRAGEVLLVDDGVTLYASLNPADYQIPSQYPANTCGTISADGGGCYPFITFGGSGAALMGTRGADGSMGTVDGRGQDTLVGSTQSWWDVAAAAKSGGNQNNPILVRGDGVDNVTISQIELTNSPMYHVEVSDGHGLTVWGVQIDAPATARNTDGIDPVSESEVTIRHDMIQDGDDCVAVKANPGTPSRNITVDDVHCYGTHGLSIGSQTAGGVSNVLFQNSTLDGYDSLGNAASSGNGIQIKSDAQTGGVTQRVTYAGICMTRVKHLLIFNPHYADGGTSIPAQRDIVLNGVVSANSLKGAYSIFQGYDAAHVLQIDLENINLDNTTQDGNHGSTPTLGESPTEHVNAGTYNTNIVPAGPFGDSVNDVTVTPISGTGSVPSCAFPAFGPPPAA